MTTKKVLLALAATSLLAFGSVAPVYAEDPPPPADDSSTMDVPADPDSSAADPGDATPDPGTDEGAAGDSSGSDSSGDSQPQ
jgi:hypothetical protein